MFSPFDLYYQTCVLCATHSDHPPRGRQRQRSEGRWRKYAPSPGDKGGRRWRLRYFSRPLTGNDVALWWATYRRGREQQVIEVQWKVWCRHACSGRFALWLPLAYVTRLHTYLNFSASCPQSTSLMQIILDTVTTSKLGKPASTRVWTRELQLLPNLDQTWSCY